MLDLHVWGSAFGLPSIDPECLAIITYLHNASPTTQWRIIPSNDPSLTPANQLPALHHDGAWIGGFGPIVDYLTSSSASSPSQPLCRNLDHDLTPSQRADALAYAAFLRASAAPLLDLSLYVSAANWAEATRPEYSRLLSFPLTWTIPPLIRGEAIKRTDHLGLAELDSDFDPNGSLHLSTAGRDALPETFRRHLPAVSKKSVKDEMTPEQAAAIRLFSITGDCMSTLSDMLVAVSEEGTEAETEAGKGKPPRFLRPELTSLDCLAFGYLALMRDAPVPRTFLRDWMTQKATRLSRFVEGIRSDHLPPLTDLPFHQPERTTALSFGARLLDSSILNMPEVGTHYAEDKRVRAERGSTTSLVDGRALFLFASMVAGAALVYARRAYVEMPPFGARTQTWGRLRPGGSKLSEYGELGLMMQGLGQLYSPAAAVGRTASDGRIAQTDSEVD